MGTVAIRRPFTVVLSASQVEVEGQAESEGRTKQDELLTAATEDAASPIRPAEVFMLE